MLLKVLYFIITCILFGFLLGWIYTFRTFLDKKAMDRPYIKAFHITLTYATVLINLIIYAYSFGGVRFAFLIIGGPYLIIFASNSIMFGNYAKYYPKGLRVINKITHITCIIPNILLPDTFRGNSWAFCHILPLNKSGIGTVLFYAAAVIFIIHIVFFLTQVIWCSLEKKKVKVIIDKKIAEQKKLQEREETGKLNFD